MFGVKGFGLPIRVWGLEFGAQGLRFRAEGLWISVSDCFPRWALRAGDTATRVGQG